MFAELMSLRRTSAPPSGPSQSTPRQHQHQRQRQPGPIPLHLPNLTHRRGAPSGRRLSRAHPNTLRCRSCSADLAFHSQIISKCFHGRHGRAYLLAPPPPPTPASRRTPLVSTSSSSSPATSAAASTTATAAAAEANELVNIRVGRAEDRNLVTGPHTVADITCAGCGAVVGWKYLDARDPGQRYKVGKFILETRRVVGFQSWEDLDVADVDVGEESDESQDGGDEEEEEEEEDGVVVFDSEDEDECDDIFAGVWDAKVVAKRRRSKVGGGGMGGYEMD
ncbi:hypothetical protein NEMBOFW57_006341 [Staphylotrichum longicolle]|uniref:Yippee domain-containing protein n=1 Tax=Staphylotrichum longicolle TaxID=669026 RepID=A0AAD4EYB6_9PEZI|nr:hypothetical protein NEMBOFW57_006341 [Staphylotrichum longicolle]